MTKRALLIGINEYEYKEYFGGNLTGSINDIILIHHALSNYLEFDSRNIITLTDQTNNKPTRENIVAYFNKLIEDTQKGDVVFIHYSGHGMQTVGHDKSSRPHAESIVPRNSGRPPVKNRDIYHYEINQILQQITSKRPSYIITVFDSCYSGGVTRGISAEPLPSVSGSYPMEQRTITMAGCQETEKVPEATSNNSEFRTEIVEIIQKGNGFLNKDGVAECGMWTLALFSALRGQKERLHELNYYEIWKIASEFLPGALLPEYIGCGAPPLLHGVAFHPLPETLAVEEVDVENKKIQANAGELFGITQNSVYQVGSGQEFIVEDVTFNNAILTTKNGEQIDITIRGSLLAEIEHYHKTSALHIALDVDESILKDFGNLNIKAFEEVVKRAKCAIIPKPFSKHEYDLKLKLFNKGSYPILANNGIENIDIPSLVVLNSENVMETNKQISLADPYCLHRLEHILLSFAHYHDIRLMSEYPKTKNDLSRKIEFEILYEKDGSTVRLKARPGGQKWPTPPEIVSGTTVRMEIINLSNRDVFCAVVDLTETGCTKPVYPALSTACSQITSKQLKAEGADSVSLGKLNCKLTYPSIEILKLFVATNSFSVKKELVESIRGQTRGNDANDLEVLLNSMDKYTRRGFSGCCHWTSMQIEFINIPS